jgi:hypothetical protein
MQVALLLRLSVPPTTKPIRLFLILFCQQLPQIQNLCISLKNFSTGVCKTSAMTQDSTKKQFIETGKPRIIVYQKAIASEKQEQSLKDFIASLLENDKEYF